MRIYDDIKYIVIDVLTNSELRVKEIFYSIWTIKHLSAPALKYLSSLVNGHLFILYPNW